jgi:hypothetical protein
MGKDNQKIFVEFLRNIFDYLFPLKNIKIAVVTHCILICREIDHSVVSINLDRLLSYAPLILLIKELMIMAIRHMKRFLPNCDMTMKFYILSPK